LVGFLSATTDSAEAFASIFRKRRSAFARAVARSVLARPSRLKTVASLLPALGSPHQELGDEARAELLSFGVSPGYRTRSGFFKSTGRHVSMELLDYAYGGLRAHGVRQVRVFVVPEEVDPFVNEFYRRADFQLLKRVRRLGIECNCYLRRL
jgi:ribosomal protein S18 acetylase RimI-like enzyme